MPGNYSRLYPFPMRQEFPSGTRAQVIRSVADHSMSRTSLLLLLVSTLLTAQNAGAPNLEAQAAALRALVEKVPKAALNRVQIGIHPPGLDWEIGYPSAVAMDDSGTIYVLQRGENDAAVLVLNSE